MINKQNVLRLSRLGCLFLLSSISLLSKTGGGTASVKEDSAEKLVDMDTKNWPNGSGNHHDALDQRPYDLSWQFRSYYQPLRKFKIQDNEKIELYYGGAIKTDGYFVRNALTLQDDRPDDAFNQFRQRSELSLLLKYKQNVDATRPAVESKITLGNTTFWRTNESANYDVEVNTPYDKVFYPMAVQFQEAWFKINLDQLKRDNEKNFLGLKAGFFPFFVGRGISLGDWYSGGATSYGFTKTQVARYAPRFPAGILLNGDLSTKYDFDMGYDIYYSPSVTEEITSSMINSNQFASPHIKGAASDRHIVAGRLRLSRKFSKNSIGYLEPYFVYYKSPRNSIRTPSDASTRLSTFGFMWDHKVKGFEVNMEFAQQFGRQRIASHVRYDRPNPAMFIKSDSSNNKYFNALGATNVSGNLTNGASGVNFKRPVNFADPDAFGTGDDSFDKDGVSQANAGTGPFFHRMPASYEEWLTLGRERNFCEYQRAYELELRGRMFMADIRYSFPNTPLQLFAAVGFSSGDDYPYNNLNDKYWYNDSITTPPTTSQADQKSKQFLPLRDYHYTGLWASPMIMINAGAIPRPNGFSLADLQAVNEYDSMSNLRYIVLGGAFSPYENFKTLKIESNVCLYWTDKSPLRWDPNAIPPSGYTLLNSTLDNISPPIANSPNAPLSAQPIAGWLANERGSNFLGWELNTLIKYYITENTDMVIKMGIFFPDKLFDNLKGQPNVNTAQSFTVINSNDGSSYTLKQNKGLGSHRAYGIDIRLRYSF